MNKTAIILLTITLLMLYRVESPAIVGGSSEPGYDAVGAFLYSDSSICGGTLISNKWVLSAAHCFDGTTVSSFILGSPFGSLDASSYPVASVHMNPSYSGTDNDIALVRLSVPAEGVTPLPYNTDSSAVTAGVTITYVGYGVTAPSSTDEGTKRSTTAQVSSVTSNQFSTDSSSSGPCNGDSGAPGFIDNSGIYIAGIVSAYDASCNSIALNTLVSEYTVFINDIITTTDAAAPQFLPGYPSPRNITDTAFEIDLQLDEPGSVYYALTASGSPEPSGENILNGTAGLQNGVYSVSSASTLFSLSIKGLSAETAYDLYLIAGDNAVGPNYQGTATKLNVTTGAAGSTGTNNPPAKPVLISPVNGATGLSLPMVFSWSAASDPDADQVRYELLIAEDELFTSPVTYQINTQRRFPVSFTGLSLLFLLIFFGMTGKRKFSIKKIMPLILFLLIISGGMMCGNSDNKGEGINTTTMDYTLNNLNSSTTYYWKIIAIDEHGAETESDPWSFTTL